MKYLIENNPLAVIDKETGETLKYDTDVSFEVSDMNAALRIMYWDKEKDDYEITPPIVCYDNVLEEVAKVTGDYEWLDFIEYEEE